MQVPEIGNVTAFVNGVFFSLAVFDGMSAPESAVDGVLQPEHGDVTGKAVFPHQGTRFRGWRHVPILTKRIAGLSGGDDRSLREGWDMKITDSGVTMTSVRRYRERREEETSLRVEVRRPSSSEGTSPVPQGLEPGTSALGKAGGATAPDPEDRGMLLLKALIVEILSGREVKTLNPEDFAREDGTSPTEGKAGETYADEGSGWGLVYSRQSRYEETETVAFNARGVIRTGDGEEISFNLHLDMSRSFVEATGLLLRMGDPALTDPLVINLDGRAAELTETRFAFDLNRDGRDDSMPGLRGGSGYLVLDHNGDGVVNDGGELFGPTSGDGYSELAAYDVDGNGWIDQDDPVFQRLRVWRVDGPDGGVLETLEAGRVGAIHLGSVSTAFDLKDSENELQGRITETGIFVRENGTVGTTQQLDLKV